MRNDFQISDSKIKELKVLFIEDSDKDYQEMREAIYDHYQDKLKVTWVKDLKTASSVCLQLSFDVILMDYELSVYSDFSVFEDNATLLKHIPVVLITDKIHDNFDIDAIKDVAVEFLSKENFTPTLLLKTLQFAIERQKIINRLTYNEERIKLLYSNSIDAIALLNDEFYFMDVNSAFRKILKIDGHEITKLNMAQLFKYDNDYIYFIDALEKDNSIINQHFKIITYDNKELEVLISISQIDLEESDLSTYQLIIHDITEYKETQRKLAGREKMASTGRMARLLGHEIRNPLTTINLAISQIKTDFPETEFYAEIVEKNSKRINQLIKDLLSVSAPHQLQIEQNNIGNSLDMICSTLSDRLKLTNITLHQEYENSEEVLYDESRFRIAILNLLVNSMEALGNDGHIWVRLYDGNENELILEVEDNGPGMTVDTKEQLFNPFFTSKKTGSGLGLTNFMQIMESHNWEYEVESELEKGAKFFVKIPSKSRIG